MNPWPTNPTAIRAASRIGARQGCSPAFRTGLVWLGALAVNLALWASVLYFLAAVCSAARTHA